MMLTDIPFSQIMAQIVITVIGVGHVDCLSALLDHGVAVDEVGPVSCECGEVYWYIHWS